MQGDVKTTSVPHTQTWPRWYLSITISIRNIVWVSLVSFSVIDQHEAPSSRKSSIRSAELLSSTNYNNYRSIRFTESADVSFKSSAITWEAINWFVVMFAWKIERPISALKPSKLRMHRLCSESPSDIFGEYLDHVVEHKLQCLVSASNWRFVRSVLHFVEKKINTRNAWSLD